MIREPFSVGLISVILPTYNRLEHLPASIESVLGQTYQNIELIIVDDGSSDGTDRYVASLKDNRIRFIALAENGGVSRARNAGIEAARGEYIAFQDSDDQWLPEKLDRQYAHAKENAEAKAFFCSLVRVNPKTAFAEIRPAVSLLGREAEIKELILQHSLIWTQTMFFHRDVFARGFRFDDEILRVQDWDLAISVSRVFSVKYLPEVLVIANETEGSLMSEYEQYLHDLVLMYEKNESELSDYPRLNAQSCRRIAYLAADYPWAASCRYWCWKAFLIEPLSVRSILNLGSAAISVTFFKALRQLYLRRRRAG